MTDEIKPNTIVTVHDAPGPGGAHHEYRVSPVAEGEFEPVEPVGRFARIQFQKGAVKEAGVNGCQMEDLLGIVLHRLTSFQNGPFACNENAMCAQHVEAAMYWLQLRTAERQAQGVEGMSLSHLASQPVGSRSSEVQPHESMVTLGEQSSAT